MIKIIRPVNAIRHASQIMVGKTYYSVGVSRDWSIWTEEKVAVTPAIPFKNLPDYSPIHESQANLPKVCFKKKSSYNDGFHYSWEYLSDLNIEASHNYHYLFENEKDAIEYQNYCEYIKNNDSRVIQEIFENEIERIRWDFEDSFYFYDGY